MRHLDLFSGIGGFALAVEKIWPNSEHIFCDNDRYCRELLKIRFPNSKIYGDIKEIKSIADANLREGRPRNESKPRETTCEESGSKDTDLLTGGFPCQPFSQAGKRRGTDDDRYLWPEMLRVIRLAKPRWVIAENVRGLLTMQNGMVFEQVCSDLENSGYEVQPFIIPAVAVNAPHRRDRIWFVAHALGDRADRKKKRRKLSEAPSKQKQNREKYGSSRQSLRTASGKRGERFAKNGFMAEIARNSKSAGQSGGDERQRKTQYGRTGSRSDQLFTSDTESKRKGRLSGKECGIEKRTMEQSKSKGSEIRCEGERHIGDDPNSNPSRLQKPRAEQQANRSRQSHKNIGNTKSDAEHSFGKISQRENALTGGSSRNASYAESGKSRKPSKQKRWKGFERGSWERSWLEVATELCGVDDGLPAELDGFELSKSRHRVERLKALGNAIVPQVTIEIMKAIKKTDESIGRT
jgi:DNA (cytosine-5)-methyltransferase 1